MGAPATADYVLVERMARRDERALGELYDRHRGLVYSLALAIVGERADADEVVADALAQAWRNRPGLRRRARQRGGVAHPPSRARERSICCGPAGGGRAP